MLLPHPESDLTLNLMFLGGEIVDLLRKEKKFVYIEKVLKVFLKKDPKRSFEHFLDALTFLFLMGFVDIDGYKIKLRRKKHVQQTLF